MDTFSIVGGIVIGILLYFELKRREKNKSKWWR